MAYLKNIGIVHNPISKGIFAVGYEKPDTTDVLETFFWIDEFGNNIVDEFDDNIIFLV